MDLTQRPIKENCFIKIVITLLSFYFIIIIKIIILFQITAG